MYNDLSEIKYYQNKAMLRDNQYYAILECEEGEYILASEEDIIRHPELKTLKEIK